MGPSLLFSLPVVVALYFLCLSLFFFRWIALELPIFSQSFPVLVRSGVVSKGPGRTGEVTGVETGVRQAWAAGRALQWAAWGTKEQLWSQTMESPGAKEGRV